VARIPDHVRANIIEAARNGRGCSQIARDTGIAPSTVSRICKAAGVTFDRAQTAAATQAHTIDAKARRAELALLLIEDAHRLRTQLWTQHEYRQAVGGMNPEVLRWTETEPNPTDKLKLMQAVNTAAARHEALWKLDNADPATAAAQSMVEGLAKALGLDKEDTP